MGNQADTSQSLLAARFGNFPISIPPPSEPSVISVDKSFFQHGFTIMLTIPVYNAAGEQVGQETIDPADFGGEINKQLLHDVVLMHLAARRVGTVNTRGRADVAGSGKKLFRQKGTGNARAGAKRTNKRKGGGVAFARRNRDYRYTMPKKAVRAAIRMALLSKFQDNQALVLDGLNLTRPQTKVVARALRSIRRPDLTETEAAEAVGETKTQVLKRTLEGRTILLGTPGHDPVLYRSARNIEGVAVAPVSEFNTYDILKQRYLVLTREALTALKERVKDQAAPRDSTAATQPAAGPES
jgi:large subunit ribosomal protein L4